jgi:hypothetical protein
MAWSNDPQVIKPPLGKFLGIPHPSEMVKKLDRP